MLRIVVKVLNSIKSPSLFQNMFEINYSQLIEYEILEKLVTLITRKTKLTDNNFKFALNKINAIRFKRQLLSCSFKTLVKLK